MSDEQVSTPINTPTGRTLTRREILGGAGALAATSLVPSVLLSGSAEAATRTQAQVPTPRKAGDSVVVLLTLYGGNDGLNTIAPNNPAYVAARGPVAVQPAQALRIDDALGFHPSLVGIKALFDQGKIGLVNGVGYPSPNRSHFRSMDIWQSGVPDGVELTGWLGRWHDATGADPIRMLSIGPSVPRALIGRNGGAGAIPNGNVNLPGGAKLTNPYTESVRNPPAELGGWGARIAVTGGDLLRISQQVSPILKATSGAASVSLEAPPTGYEKLSALDKQLDEVSLLIKAKIPTRVFSVSLGGFDTHANELGNHADLMGTLDRGISRFLGSLASDPRANDVVIVVYSEFGRRVVPNLSNGTDHGTAGPVIIAGHGIKGGVHSEYPSLTDLDNGDLRITTDFRRVYSTILEQGLGADPAAVIGKRYEPLGFL